MALQKAVGLIAHLIKVVLAIMLAIIRLATGVWSLGKKIPVRA